MTHHASWRFWRAYEALPAPARQAADHAFELLKQNAAHPSLRFRHVGRFRSVRVGLHYRALGVDVPDGVLWFWIGTHAEYDQLIG